jgi:alpha-mannosidase
MNCGVIFIMMAVFIQAPKTRPNKRVEKGPERVKLQIKGSIDGSPFTQWLTLTQGQRRIDMQVKIDWKGNPGIGEPTPPGTYKATTTKSLL